MDAQVAEDLFGSSCRPLRHYRESETRRAACLAKVGKSYLENMAECAPRLTQFSVLSGG